MYWKVLYGLIISDDKSWETKGEIYGALWDIKDDDIVMRVY